MYPRPAHPNLTWLKHWHAAVHCEVAQWVARQCLQGSCQGAASLTGGKAGGLGAMVLAMELKDLVELTDPMWRKRGSPC